MRVIKAATLGDAHEKAVRYIAENGDIVKTEDLEMTLQTPPLTIVVDRPLAEPRLSPKSPSKEMFAKEYAANILYGTGNGFVYDYNSRLFRYNEKVDQIQYIIDKLSENKTSRRAMAITWQPEDDIGAKDVPCLQLITCGIHHNRLNMQVVFRSNDVLLAMGLNMYGLVSLQDYIAGCLGVQVGTYTHVIMCPHIYYKRDENYLRDFI